MSLRSNESSGRDFVDLDERPPQQEVWAVLEVKRTNRRQGLLFSDEGMLSLPLSKIEDPHLENYLRFPL